MRSKDDSLNTKQYIQLNNTLLQNYDNSKFINKGLEFLYTTEFRL